MEWDKLIEAAMKAREKAYAPYSNYQVGAAIQTLDGEIYSGCNIENAAFGSTICAERTAIFKAVSEGKRDFLAIAIAGSPEGAITQLAWPCGVCRQVMAEFCNPETFQIIVAKSITEYEMRTLAQLLPEAFGSGNVKDSNFALQNKEN